MTRKIRMYKYIWNKLYRLWYMWDFIRYFFHITKKSTNKLFIVDLDNTLADTWPQRVNMETFAWGSLPVHNRVLEFVKSFSIDQKLEVVVLSARPLSARKETGSWLTDIAGMKGVMFFLTPDAMSKWKYFKFAQQMNKLGAVIDDCSHSHEFGSVQLYEKLIQDIHSLNTRFFDYKFISDLQKY